MKLVRFLDDYDDIQFGSQHDDGSTTLIEGDIFGEIASVRGCNYGATVTAAEDSQFYVIRDFITFLKQNPNDSIYVMKMLCDRIVKMNENIVS